MKVDFQNVNNNDTYHDIIFLNLTSYASGAEEIKVLFDGYEEKHWVLFDYQGGRYFKHAGKTYEFEIVES